MKNTLLLFFLSGFIFYSSIPLIGVEQPLSFPNWQSLSKELKFQVLIDAIGLAKDVYETWQIMQHLALTNKEINALIENNAVAILMQKIKSFKSDPTAEFMRFMTLQLRESGPGALDRGRRSGRFISKKAARTIIQAFIEAGATIPSSALIIALRQKELEIFEALLEAGVDSEILKSLRSLPNIYTQEAQKIVEKLRKN